MDTARIHSRVLPVHSRVHGMYTVMYSAVFTTRTRPHSGRVGAMYMALCRVLRDRYQLRPRLRRVRYDIV